jgi:uncharacterized protein YyaL (SSP411 family)
MKNTPVIKAASNAFNSFDQIKQWILFSGIQNRNMEKEYNGGFNSWFSLEQQKYPYVYSEITGYGVSTLLFLNQTGTETKNDFIVRAKEAADWIIEKAMNDQGGIYARMFYDAEKKKDPYSFDMGSIYLFDTGMVLFGMANLYQITKDKKHLAAATKMADFIVSMQKKDTNTKRTSIYAYYIESKKFKGDINDKWSNQSGAYHAKVAMGLALMFKITKKQVYKQLAEQLCLFSYDFQQKTGRFITNTRDESTLQHPHSYTAEGLLYCGLLFGKKEYIEKAQKAVAWSMSTQLQNGGIPEIAFEDKVIPYERTDILAQVLRLACFFNLYHKKEVFETAKLTKLYERLSSFIQKEGSQKGGIQYGFESDGKEYHDINSWCSMFSVQAIYFYGLWMDKDKAKKWTPEDLVKYLV